jgi:hypothetical protein
MEKEVGRADFQVWEVHLSEAEVLYEARVPFVESAVFIMLFRLV